MNVDRITMDPAEAEQQLADYRQSLRRRADEEYEAIVQGLEELTTGRDLIHLGDVIREAGKDEEGRPRFAVARADRKTVMWEQSGRNDAGEFDARHRDATTQSDTLQVRVNVGRNPAHERWTETTRGFAIVPIVPPEGIRKIGGVSYLRGHFVLWEVEEWASRLHRSVPDRDPFLLRRLGGDLCAVVHEWDLTELERAVMTGRRGLDG